MGLTFNAKTLTRVAILTALSLIVFIIEALFPPLPFAPYVKIGLANIFILIILYAYGVNWAFIAVLAKNILGCAVTGTWFAFPFNIAGSMAGLLVSVIFYLFLSDKVSITAISISGAVFSNLARTGTAILITGAGGLIFEMPFLLVVSIIAGGIVGIAVGLVFKYLPEKILTN